MPEEIALCKLLREVVAIDSDSLHHWRLACAFDVIKNLIGGRSCDSAGLSANEKLRFPRDEH